MKRPASGIEQRKKTAADLALSDNSVKRYRDPSFNAIAVNLLPGEHYATQNAEEMIVTVLASCVSVCIRDPKVGVGGMNHFASGDWGQETASLRYGNFAMERLIKDIVKLGGRRSHLEIKVCGGGDVFRNGAKIGRKNSEFIESYLKAEGSPIAAKHLYGDHPRRVHYFPAAAGSLCLNCAGKTISTAC